MAWADSQNCGGNFWWFSYPRWLIKISQSGEGVWAVSAPHGWIIQPLKKDGSQSFLSPVDAFLSFGHQKGRFHHAFECFHFYQVWHSLTYIQTQSLEGGLPFLLSFPPLSPFDKVRSRALSKTSAISVNYFLASNNRTGLYFNAVI